MRFYPVGPAGPNGILFSGASTAPNGILVNGPMGFYSVGSTGPNGILFNGPMGPNVISVNGTNGILVNGANRTQWDSIQWDPMGFFQCDQWDLSIGPNGICQWDPMGYVPNSTWVPFNGTQRDPIGSHSMGPNGNFLLGWTQSALEDIQHLEI